MIIYRVNCKDMKQAKKIAKNLLNEKLIACANMYPCETMYEWEGELKEENEVVLIIKTLEKQEEEVKHRIRELHSYDLPAILKITARGNEEYVAWMETKIV